MKRVTFSTLPQVRISGEVLVGGRKIWITLGTADNMQCSPVEVEVPGDGPVTIEDIAVALRMLFDGVREVVVVKIKELHQAVEGEVKL